MPDAPFHEIALWLLYVGIPALLAGAMVFGVLYALCWCRRIGQAVLDIRAALCREDEDEDEACALFE